MGPYAFKNSEWVSFDDVDTIEQKMKLLNDWNLGGAMIWALDLDDFNNQCGNGKYPILSTINEQLGRLSDYTRPNLLETTAVQALPRSAVYPAVYGWPFNAGHMQPYNHWQHQQQPNYLFNQYKK
jgi:hypothetical protein